jgi:hypothetical protein
MLWRRRCWHERPTTILLYVRCRVIRYVNRCQRLSLFDAIKVPYALGLMDLQLTKCVAAVVEKLKATPCQDIQEAYLACLDGKMTKTGNLVKCRPLADQLEDCTAKHVGRLD